jgi:hypothetical protein
LPWFMLFICGGHIWSCIVSLALLMSISESYTLTATFLVHCSWWASWTLTVPDWDWSKPVWTLEKGHGMGNCVVYFKWGRNVFLIFVCNDSLPSEKIGMFCFWRRTMLLLISWRTRETI